MTLTGRNHWRIQSRCACDMRTGGAYLSAGAETVPGEGHQSHTPKRSKIQTLYLKIVFCRNLGPLKKNSGRNPLTFLFWSRVISLTVASPPKAESWERHCAGGAYSQKFPQVSENSTVFASSVLRKLSFIRN